MNLPTLKNWTIVDLTQRVISAQIFGSNEPFEQQGRNIYTEQVVLIDPELRYVVTNKRIIKLGEVDKAWFETSDAKQKLKELS